MQSMEKKCSVAKKCGGCQFQGVTYSEQLKKKQKMEEGLLKKFCKVEPIIGMKNPCYYRNKVHSVFGRDRKGNVISGTYEANSHRIVPVEECMIEDKKSQEIIHTVRKLLPSFKIKTYNEDSGYGLLRHVMVRRGFKSGEIMVILVLGSPILPSKNNFVKALRKEHPEITTVVLNVNDKKTSMVLGDREITIYGKGFIRDELCGCNFRISPKSFYQVNPVQTEILYQTAIDYAELTGKETVIDAYCGIGTISLIAAKHAKKVIGVEVNGDAVKDAKINAKENNISNAEFYKGDAGAFMVKMAENQQKADVVFMDPPRSGSDERFMSSVIKLDPKRVVYVSCGPDTLARDLKYFEKHGYKARKIQPVDMFPYTEHVETVVLLSKGDIDSKRVKVEFSLEDMDMSEFQNGATYEQIKEYILCKTGLKVSSLYISQVKRKCGLEVGKHYNMRKATRRMDCLQDDLTTAASPENDNSQGLAKSEDAKQPQCPPEKEQAIMDAFKHFGLI